MDKFTVEPSNYWDPKCSKVLIGGENNTYLALTGLLTRSQAPSSLSSLALL